MRVLKFSGTIVVHDECNLGEAVVRAAIKMKQTATERGLSQVADHQEMTSDDLSLRVLLEMGEGPQEGRDKAQ